MNTLFSPRPRTQARLGRWLLGLWLFALLQGFANACLTQSRHPELAAAALTAVERAAHEAHGHEDGLHEAAAHEALCLKTCDDTQSSTWSPAPNWQPELGFALPAAFAPWQPALAAGAQEPVHGPAPPGDPPATIRFLKLNR